MIKKKYLIILFICLCNSVVLFSQNFKPFTDLYSIKTKKFEIIYSAETRRTAFQLAAIADDIYEKYSKILGIDVSYLIPVTITSEPRIHNAYAYPVTYPHVVIYDTPSDPNFTSYKNDIEDTFIHELTHIFLLAPNETTVSKIFGSWFSFVNLSTTYFMTEGSAVSVESLDGFGRANDPLVRQRLRQDIREAKFKTPIQATDAWDLYPFTTVAYEYGGLFSQYIQDRFGMEKYSLFLRRIQNSWIPSFNYYNAGTYNAFKKIYDIPFLDVWADFQYNFTTLDVDINTNDSITKNDTEIRAITHKNNKLYYINNSYSILMEYDPIEKKNNKIKTINKTTDSLDLNEDGSKVLIGSTMRFSTFPTPFIQEYDIKKNRYTKLKFKDLRLARYFRDGVIGIAADLNNSYIAYYKDDGKTEEILLSPSKNISYDYPTVIDDDRIAFIYTDNGIRHLMIYNYNNKTISTIISDSQNDSNIWKYMRYLSYSDDKILFSYNDDDRFYKLGIIDLNNNKLLLTKIDYSGSILNPVLVDDNIYYKGRFSKTEALMVYPQDILNIEGASYNINIAQTKDVGSIKNVVDEYEKKYNDGLFGYDEKQYIGMRYMNPLKMWFPLPTYAEGSPYFVTGVGIATMVTDPIDNNQIIFLGGFDIVSKFFDIDLSWNNYSLLFPLSINIRDKVIYSSIIRFRSTMFSVGMSPYFYINDRSSVVFTPYFSAGLLFYSDASWKTDPSTGNRFIDVDYKNSAYIWDFRDYIFNVGLNMHYQYNNKSLNSIRKDLISFLLAPIYSIRRNEYRIDTKINLQSKYLPLKFTAYAGYSDATNGIDFSSYSQTFGGRSIFGGDEFISYVNDNALSDNWLFGFELDLIGAIEIQNNLSYFYINRLYASLGYRASYYDKNYLNAATLKLGIESSFMLSVALPFNIEGIVALQLPPNYNNRNNFFSIDNFYFGFNLTTAIDIYL